MMFDDMRPVTDPTAQTMMEGVALKTQNTFGPINTALKSADGLQRAAYDLRRMIEEQADFLKSKGAYLKMGSYAWAVSGDRTDSGNPILLSGPQMGFAAPSIATEGAITSDYLTVSGMTVAGVPAIFIGRTPTHAWGFQVGHASAWDYYMEEDADVQLVREETINVRLGEPVTFQGYASERGPAVTKVDDKWLSWKYAHRGYEWDLAGGILSMARADSVEAFGAAVANIGISQHVTYVDNAGNIAYWLSGRTPVREAGDWRVPQGMFEGQPVLEWDAAVVQDLPHQMNPSQGYFAGWNNKAAPNWVDHAATAGFGPFHRAEIIESFFNSRGEGETFSFEELRDYVVRLSVNPRFYGGNPLPVIKDRVLEVLRNNPTDTRNQALELLENWDGVLIDGGDSQWLSGRNFADGAILTETIIPKLISLTFDDELGQESPDNLVGPLYRYQNFVHSLGETGVSKSYDWFSNITDSAAPQTADAIILAAVDEAMAELGAAPWGVDGRGNIAHIHPLFGDLIAVLNAPPITMGLPMTPAGNRATYTQVVEMSAEGPQRIEVMSTLGQSGEILGDLNDFTFHPHYLDQKDNFDAFMFRSVPLFD
jgi:penicillin amidase